MWLVDRLTPGSPDYNLSNTISLQGHLDVGALRRTLNEIVTRHESLRTTFELIDDEPVQIVAAEQSIPLPIADLAGLPPAKQGTEARRIAEEEALKPFDLEFGPLFRTSLIILAIEEHVVRFTTHHIVFDGWSVAIFMNELATIYEAFSQGQPSPLPELAIQYGDFAEWQREWLQGEVLDRQLDYWKRQLAHLPPPLELPSDRPRPAATSHGGRESLELPAELLDSLKEFSQSENVTLFATLFAAFQTLLFRYTEQTDIVVVSPIANRNRADIEGLIGFFVNMLALRTDFSGNPSFRELLGRVRRTTVDAFSHQDLPAQKVLEALRLHRDPEKLLAPIAFVLQNVPKSERRLAKLTVRPLLTENQTAKTELTLYVSETGVGLVVTFEYLRDLYSAATIRRLLHDFSDLLRAVVKSPETSVAALPPFGRVQETHQFDELYGSCNLTRNQLLIWTAQKLHPEAPTYNVAETLTILGEVNRPHFQQAFQALVDSNDAFRTVIEEVNGLPRQRVLGAFPYSVEYMDFSQATEPDRDAEAWMKERCQMPLDLGQCGFDCVLIKVADQKYIWYLNQHHLFTDAWSVWLNFKRAVELYERSVRGQLDVGVTYPSFQEYLDFEHRRRGSTGYKKAEAYWQEKTSEQLEPPTFYGNRVLHGTNRGHRVPVELGATRSAELKFHTTQQDRFAQTTDASVFVLFATFLFTYLYRISGNRRLSLGTMFHNRPSRFKQTAGLFLEMIALRLTIEPRETFSTLLGKVNAELRQSIRHAQYSIRNSPHDKTYEVVLNYINRSNASHRTFNGAPVEVREIYTGHTDNTLGLRVLDFGASGAFTLEFDFHSDVFDETASQAAIGHFLRVVDAYLVNPKESLCNVALLSDDEKRRILREFNDTRASFPREKTLIDIFAAQVRKTPDRTAVVCEDQSATYAELDRRSNQLSHRLRSMGVGPDVMVGICMDRSLELLVGILGILKAGGAYIPLDTNYPIERLAFILNDAHARVLITQEGPFDEDGLAGLISSNSCPLLRLRFDREMTVVTGEREDSLGSSFGAANLSYMIYTSGSTGSPKGAMVEHRGMLNHLFLKLSDLAITEADVVAQTASQCFDISVWQFLAALLVGGRVHIYPDAIAFDPLHLPREMRHHGVTIFETVPSLLQTVLSEQGLDIDPGTMRWVIVTGEALPPQLCRQWLGMYPEIPLLNAYGPTECSDDVTHYRIADPPAERCPTVPIGHALANLQIYITDGDLQPLPTGVAGELCVGGVGVGRGYCNDPKQTARVFIPNPFAQRGGRRLYRTGDLTRYLEEGDIEFIGRLDHQVKIRGFRIELGEVEALLKQHPSVTEAVVLADRPKNEDGRPNTALTRLIGYLVSNGESVPSAGELQRFLRQKLPNYMVPQGFVALDQLPPDTQR